MKRETIENKPQASSWGSGFLLGLLLGVLFTLLLTTKKGREILRDLMDKLIHKLSEIDTLHEKMMEEEAEDGNDYVKPQPEDVRKEIRFLAAELHDEDADSTDEEKVTKDHVHEKVLHVSEPEQEDMEEHVEDETRHEETMHAARTSEHETNGHAVHDEANGKNGKHKLTKRLFFHKGKKD